MQCSFCSNDLNSDAVICVKCGAHKIIQRTSVGVYVGWAGMVIALIWVMLGIPLLILPFIGYHISASVWITLVVGTIVATALLWYSKSTEHAVWIRQED